MEEKTKAELYLAKRRAYYEDRLERDKEESAFLEQGRTTLKPLALELLQRVRQLERELVNTFPPGEDPPKCGLPLSLFGAMREAARTLRAIRFEAARELAISREASTLMTEHERERGERMLELHGGFKRGKRWFCHIRGTSFFGRNKRLHNMQGERLNKSVVRVILGHTLESSTRELRRINENGLYTLKQARNMEAAMRAKEQAMLAKLEQGERK